MFLGGNEISMDDLKNNSYTVRRHLDVKDKQGPSGFIDLSIQYNSVNLVKKNNNVTLYSSDILVNDIKLNKFKNNHLYEIKFTCANDLKNFFKELKIVIDKNDKRNIDKL